MVSLNFSDIWPIQRTKQLANHLFQQVDKKGQIRKPLLNLDAKNCPPDILHMRRASFTKLLDQVIQFSMNQKAETKLVAEMSSEYHTNLFLMFSFKLECC